MTLAALLHAYLESSQPAAGDTIRSEPDVFRLVFTEPVESEFATMTLASGDGHQERLALRSDPHNAYALIADTPVLKPGGYLVTWRIVSADGHPVGGSFQFWAAIGPAGWAPAEILAGTPPAPKEPEGHEHGGPAGLTGEPPIIAAALRSASQLALLALAGLLTLLTWGIRIEDDRLATICRRLAFITPVLLAGDFLLWLQHASPNGAIDGESLSAAMATQNGLLNATRIGLSLLVIWALLLARSRPLAAVLAMLAVVAAGATGHPAAISPAVAVPAKMIHLAAAALWTAGLAVLAFARRDGEDFRNDAWAVSRIALYAVVTVAATGAIETLLFMPKFAGLFSSPYGWLVLAKVAGLSALVVYGYRNRYRLMPGLPTSGAEPLRRSVRQEIGWMAAVVVVAAFLSYEPPPVTPKAAQAMEHDMPEHHHEEP